MDFVAALILPHAKIGSKKLFFNHFGTGNH
jgi:hypothetical protein